MPGKNPGFKTVQNSYFFIFKSGVVLNHPPFFLRYENVAIVMLRTRFAF